MRPIGRQRVIYNKTMTLADTEYSQAIPSGVVKLLVQCRGQYDSKLSFSATGSSTNYITIKAGSVYYEDMIDGSPGTVYIQSPTAGQVMEILAWVR